MNKLLASRVRHQSRRVLYSPAPLVGRGYVTYVEVTKGQWVCDQCIQKVIPSQFDSHAKGH